MRIQFQLFLEFFHCPFLNKRQTKAIQVTFINLFKLF